MEKELSRLDATACADLVRRGEVKPLELVEAAIARIEEINPKLNAVITPLFEKACAAAQSPGLPDGPLRGVPFLLKDLGVQTQGDPFHAGMKFLKDNHHVSDHDTFLAAKFREAGLIVLGKTNTPELGPITTTEPIAYGPTRNPWDTTRSPAGSSGGSAAAVASRMVPMAHANDGGGSIRMPASACGLVGLKPSRGRVSQGPDHGEIWSGCVADLAVSISVRDTAAVLDAVHGPCVGDPYFAPLPARPYVEEVGAEPGNLRIGVLHGALNPRLPTHPDCKAAAAAAAKLLEGLGHRVEESWPECMGEEEFSFRFGSLTFVGTAADLDYWGAVVGKTIGPDDVEPYTWDLAERGRAITASEYIQNVDWLHAYNRRLAAWWEGGFDLLLTPTFIDPPTPLGAFEPTQEEPLRGMLQALRCAHLPSFFNMSGQPAISLPLHWTEGGLPIGVQLVAAYGREDLLIRVAAQLEAAAPWADKLPPVCA